MTCKVLSAIEKYRMLDGVSSVCVGVSGGADSIALLHILRSLQHDFGYTLHVAHINHHLRGEESDRDAAFVRSFCASRGIDCTVFDYDIARIAGETGQSVELCGREMRYLAFRSLNCDAIAVAHTRTDCIETALFHLARGTSLKGAAGIPPKNGNIIRPLIECTRAEVEAYIAEKQLAFVTDSSNESDVFQRNYIRHHIMSAFCKRFPSFEENFGRFIENAAMTQNYLEQSVSLLRKQAETDNGFLLSVLQQAHPAVLQCFLREQLACSMNKPVEEENIALCRIAIENGNGKVQIATDRYFEVHASFARITKVDGPDSWSVAVRDTAETIHAPCGEYRIQLCSGCEKGNTDRRHWIDPEKLPKNPVLRSRLPGDVFHSPVRKNSKTLKKLLNEMKIPPEMRNSVAVLSADDDENAVIWVENVGADAAFQAEPTTDPVWIVTKERNAHTHD